MDSTVKAHCALEMTMRPRASRRDFLAQIVTVRGRRVAEFQYGSDGQVLVPMVYFMKALRYI